MWRPVKIGTPHFVLKIHFRFYAADQSSYAVGQRYDTLDNMVASCGKNSPIGCPNRCDELGSLKAVAHAEHAAEKARQTVLL